MTVAGALTVQAGPAPSAEAKPRVVPMAVFAAGRQRFDVLIRGFCNALEVRALLFVMLPLEENGWDRETVVITHVRNEPQGMIWRMERG